MKTSKNTVLVIVGPTASGKTAAAVEAAKILDGEIISADSMQIYAGMNIGTAKPTAEEMAGIPHHLIGHIAPDQAYSVADFVGEAEKCIQEIISRHHVPIVAGGTGLYINGLTLPWDFQADNRDDTIRTMLERRAESEGADVLFRELTAADPETAAMLHPNNVKRVIRALEIVMVSGKTKSQWDREAQAKELPFDYLLTGLKRERSQLYERIDIRVDEMIEQGLVDEVRALLAKGYSPSLTSMQALGYKEWLPYLNGEADYAETVRILKRDTRHFAKRQLTWFRKDQRIQWFEPDQYDSMKDLAQDLADYYNKTVKGITNEC